MGQIGIVQTTERATEDGAKVRDVTVDLGEGNTVSADLVLPPGVDAQPLPGDTAHIEDAPGAGNKVVIGFTDSKNEVKAADGEQRIYSRESDGTPAAEIHVKADGSILIKVLKSGGAPITLETDGVVELKSPDVRLCDGAGQPVARVGDMVTGSVFALSGAPGAPITPGGAVPVPFAGQITSGQPKAKA